MQFLLPMLKLERPRAGLTQERLAELSGLHPNIDGIERGERNPSLKNISRIANALGVIVAALFDQAVL